MDDGLGASGLGSVPSYGVAIASVAGLAANGDPLVLVSGVAEEVQQARSALLFNEEDRGVEIVVIFEQGDPRRPVVIGRLWPARPLEVSEAIASAAVTIDGERFEITAASEITLTCGKASITLTRSGKIVLRGTYILSRSSGPNRIKGGSIDLN